MNFEWGSKLAERQDRAITAFLRGNFPSAEDFSRLRGNMMVRIAAVLAPCNLVIRHYALLDLMENGQVPKRYRKIEKQFNILTDCGLWREGYSYWGYTRPILLKHAEKFRENFFKDSIEYQDEWFVRTSFYFRNGKWKPVPFGDLWDEAILNCSGPGYRNHKPVTWTEHRVVVKTKALRFNLHTDTVNKIYDVSTGIPVDENGVPFRYYTGYWNKYPTKWSEIRALLKRFFCLMLG